MPLDHTTTPQHHVPAPPDQTTPAVKAVLEKTASFVAKNGRAFETRILNSDKGKTAKFAFLHATSPFHAYYEDRVRHYAEGGGADDEEGKKKAEGGASGDGNGGDKKDGEKENAASDGKGDGRSDTADSTDAGKSASAAAAAVVQRRAKASVPDPVARTLLSQRNLISEQEKSRREALDALEKAKRAAAGGGGDNNNSSKTDGDTCSEVDMAKMERAVPTVQPPAPRLHHPHGTVPPDRGSDRDHQADRAVRRAIFSVLIIDRRRWR